MTPVDPAQSEPLTDEGRVCPKHPNAGAAWDETVDERRCPECGSPLTHDPAPSEALEGLIEKLEARADEVERPSLDDWTTAAMLARAEARGLREAASMARDALPEGTQAHEPATEGVPDE